MTGSAGIRVASLASDLSCTGLAMQDVTKLASGLPTARASLLTSAATRTISVAAEVTRLENRSPNSRASLLTSAATKARTGRSRGFTLIELIFVMVLLTVVASMVAPRMSSFFRGRALSFEARRMLSLAQYAQSRAVADGVPILLWINPRAGSYGVEPLAAFATAGDRNPTYTVDPSLTITVPSSGPEPVSELEDEKLGIPEGMLAIRFNPDGFFDEISVTRIVIQQTDGDALELVPTTNRLAYEIRPVTRTD